MCKVCTRPVSLFISAREDDYYFYGLLIEFADEWSLSVTAEHAYASAFGYIS